MEKIRNEKEWDVGILHAKSKTRWNKFLNRGDPTDFLIKNLHGIGLYPGNDAKIGEQVWVWSEHMVWWYDAKVSKILEEDNKILKKIITTSNDPRRNGKKAGEKIWVEDGWIIQGKDINTWYKKGLVIKPEDIKLEHPKQGEDGERKKEGSSRCKVVRKILTERNWQKEKAKKRDANKYPRWKAENKGVKEIREQEETSNAVKSFAIKMKLRAGMTRNQWHGEDVDRKCPHCNKEEDEEHAFKSCKWTKQITKIIKESEKEWEKETKPKNKLEHPLIGTRTTAWPMKNRQSQTLAWLIWKLRKIKEHEGGSAGNEGVGGSGEEDLGAVLYGAEKLRRATKTRRDPWCLNPKIFRKFYIFIYPYISLYPNEVSPSLSKWVGQWVKIPACNKDANRVLLNKVVTTAQKRNPP